VVGIGEQKGQKEGKNEKGEKFWVASHLTWKVRLPCAVAY